MRKFWDTSSYNFQSLGSDYSDSNVKWERQEKGITRLSIFWTTSKCPLSRKSVRRESMQEKVLCKHIGFEDEIWEVNLSQSRRQKKTACSLGSDSF